MRRFRKNSPKFNFTSHNVLALNGETYFYHTFYYGDYDLCPGDTFQLAVTDKSCDDATSVCCNPEIILGFVSVQQNGINGVPIASTSISSGCSIQLDFTILDPSSLGDRL